MSGRLEVYQERRRNPLRKPAWRWRLFASNGEPLAASEAYTSQRDAWRGAKDASQAMLGIDLSAAPPAPTMPDPIPEETRGG